MRVTELASAAIKGFGLYYPEQMQVAEGGPVGDRSFYLVDDDGAMASANYDGCLLDFWSRYDPSSEILTIGQGGVVVCEGRVTVQGTVLRTRFFAGRHQEGHLVEGAWSPAISELAGEPVRLVRARGGMGGQDVEPVSLLGAASATAVGTEGDGRILDTSRFRMNIILSSTSPFAEESWIGSKLSIGTVKLEVVRNVTRCSMVQRRGGDRGSDLDVLAMIARVRGVQSHGSGQSLNMGVYARVKSPGVVSLGDPVHVHD